VHNLSTRGQGDCLHKDRRKFVRAVKGKVLSIHADFFIFRTPLLPFDEFLEWGDGLQAAPALDDAAAFERAYAADRARLRERLLALVRRPDVWEALFIASPNLDERFHLWTDAPDSKRGRKIEQVLVRYLTRMTARATPFGLCAGFSVGRTGIGTELTIEGREKYRRQTRLDMGFLVALTEALARDPRLRRAFVYRPNSSLYRAAGRVRYVESRLDGELRSYHLVAAEEEDCLNETLARAGHGATFSSLAAALVGDEVSQDEAEEYIGDLIDNQVLVPDIALPLTGVQPLSPLLEQLCEIAEAAESADRLERARAQMAEIDEAGVGVEPARYHSVARGLEGLPLLLDASRLFQVDLAKPAPEAVLGKEVLDEIRRGVTLLHQLAHYQRPESLTRFHENFVARYETREVPLVEALDEEVGVGFEAGEEISHLLKDLVFTPIASEKREADSARQKLVLRKLHETLQQGLPEMAFEPYELEAVSSTDSLPLPDSFAVAATLATSSQAALDGGDFQVFIEGYHGPSGATLLGRFCHLDEVLRQHVRRHLLEEEALRPDAVFAEVVHLPEGRIGNVVLRPSLRDFEIVYLGHSGAPVERQVPVTDLHVSIRGGRIRLRSARLGREVIPRMTNAHNYFQRGVGLYRFLCMLQQEGVAGRVRWTWGGLAHAPYLPRVRVGRLVLSRARWNVSKEELRMLGAAQSRSAGAGFRAIQAWRDERRLPRLVTLADGDIALLIDLDNALSVESFIQLVRESEEAVLEEFFPAADQHCARGPEGRFVHELIVPFVRGKSETEKNEDGVEKASERQLEPAVSPASRRRFPPGSEWLYAKLYVGTATADHVLRKLVRPVVERSLRSRAADGWFFIRYADPDHHLRLRFHGRPERLLGNVQPMLCEAVSPLLDEGLLWRLQFDTYEREVERYGGAEGILLAEQVFQADSAAVLQIIEMLETDDEGLDERWRLTLCGVDMLLTDFGLDVEAKCKLLRLARNNLLKEFAAGSTLMPQLAEKFRHERKSLELLLAARRGTKHPLAPGLTVLRRRSRRLRPVVAALNDLERGLRLSTPRPELIISFTHMHANRLLRSASRQQEFVIYDFLARLYESQIARASGPHGGRGLQRDGRQEVHGGMLRRK
jgi:lantibiotic biosynthesis protein